MTEPNPTEAFPGQRWRAARSWFEPWVLSNFGPVWRGAQFIKPVEGLVNRVLINKVVQKAPPRPYRLTTMSGYTSWDSLTDQSYNGRQLPPAAWRAEPPVEEAAALFRRGDYMAECPKSTVLFAYVAQWFTDGFLRSQPIRPPERFRDIARQDSSNHVDLSQLYGRSQQVTDALREQDGGRLKSHLIGREEFPPRLCNRYGSVLPEFKPLPAVINFRSLTLEQKVGLFAMGSDVANSQIGYAMLNVLFLREHNRIAGTLAAENPTWDDERLFCTARNILTVVLIKLVIEEYINHIAPYRFNLRFRPGSFERARWFRPNWTAVEFNLLYRWHSLLPSTLDVASDHLPLAETLFNNELLTRRGLGPVFARASTQRAGKICLYNTDPWFHERTTSPSIVQSRLVNPASYNDYRWAVGLPRKTDFAQVSSDPSIRAGLEEVYGTVANLEFFVGMFAEDLLPDSVVPELMGILVGLHAFSQLITNPLLAPKVYNDKATFSALGMEMIRTTSSLQEVVSRNLPTGSPQYRVSLTRSGWSPGSTS
jgi:prostaglandin-endoperoxide synthase 2